MFKTYLTASFSGVSSMLRYSALHFNMEYPERITQDPNPISIPVSRQELASGKLSQRNLEVAMRALHHDGLVILEDVVPDHRNLDHLNQRMLEDTMKLKEMGDKGIASISRY